MDEGSRVCAQRMLRVLPRALRGLKQGLRALPEDSLSMAQLLLMQELDAGDYTISELARRIQVHPPTVTQMVDVLVRKGWVERYHDAQDRRVVHSRLTPSGRAQLEVVKSGMMARTCRVLDRLTPTEQQTILAALDLIARLADEAAGVLPEPPTPSHAATGEESARTASAPLTALA